MSDLVDPHAKAPTVGAWDHPLAEPNVEDAQIVHSLDRFADVPGVSRLETAYRQRFRLKSWQYMTATTDELFIAFVVGTAGFASNGFVYAAELPSGTVHKKFAITPLMLGTSLAPSSTAGRHRFRAPGLSVAIENLDHGKSFAAKVSAGDLDAELSFTSGARDEHLALCVPLPGGRWNYTHKFAAFDVSGHVTIAGRRIPFVSGRSYGTLDFTKMYALRHAVWKWVALCGRTKHGKVLGLNLVDPTPDAPISENALWIDGKREAIAGVHLTAETDDAASAWKIEANNLEIAMKPVAHVEQKLDLPLVRHRLRHVVGSFSGRVLTASGHVHDLENITGIAEDYDTWW